MNKSGDNIKNLEGVEIVPFESNDCLIYSDAKNALSNAGHFKPVRYFPTVAARNLAAPSFLGEVAVTTAAGAFTMGVAVGLTASDWVTTWTQP